MIKFFETNILWHSRYELILCVSEGFLSVLLCIDNVGIETVCLHALILCVSEGFLSELLCVHIVGIGTSDLHVVILCVSEGLLSK